jgi:hypothetical protein
MHTSSILSAPRLVTVTYPGYRYADQVEAVGDLMASSDWLRTAGGEYGVGAATHLARVRLTDPAPAQITDAGIVAMLRARIADSTLPAPASNPGALYLVYFPSTTRISDGTGWTSCTDFVGYHSSDGTGSARLTYAVITDCDMGLDLVTRSATHETVEAATDPYDVPTDGWYLDPSPTDPWSTERSDEVADLCEDENAVTLGGFAIERSWSNAGAANDHPCLPAVAGEVYYNVSATPADMPTVMPGSSVTFTITGWSTAPMADWQLMLMSSDGSALTFGDMNPVLNDTTTNNGRTTTLTLTVPATAASGAVGAVRVYSDGVRFWPVGFKVM